ncbi:MAG: decaprenylphospho-beta-D-erythro-pentofuranosid-2-ulose 2-reductase [Nitriliruptorales bacterium]
MQDALGAVQSVLVLGGSSDIGRAIALALVSRRARRVVLAGRDTDALQPVVDTLRNAGATTVEAVAFDALGTDTHPSFVNDVFARHGDFDVVLLCFGVLGDQSLAENDPKHALDIIRTNYVGAVSVAIPLAQRLRVQGHGALVVLSSVAGERARRSNFVYGSSKAGLDAFAQGLGDALYGSGAKVMVVRPGFVKTKMTQGRQAAPFATNAEAVADAIVEGLRSGSEIVWVPSILRWVMAAVRHLPRPIFRKLPM